MPIERKREILGEYEKRMQEHHTLRHKERSNLKRNVIEQEIERESQIRQRIDETELAFRNLQLLKVFILNHAIVSALLEHSNSVQNLIYFCLP